MKTKRLLPFLALMAVVMVIAGCKKDSNSSSSSSTPTVDNTVTKNYFSIKDAVYVGEAFPESTSDVQIEVNMNDNVIAGGSNYITVKSPVAAQKIYVGLKDQAGFYVITPENTSKEIIYDFIMVVNQNLTDENFSVTIAILDEDGNVSQTWDVNIALITAGTGGLQISLSFDQYKDVDLHLIEPNGEHIYYNNRYSSNGGWLDLDSNPDCYIDGVNNENIFYNDTTSYIQPGTYTVYVDMWSNCYPQDNPTNFVLAIFYNGQMIQTSTGTNPIAGTFPVDEISNGGDLGNIAPVCTFVIPDNGQQPPAKSLKKLPEFLRSKNK